MRIGKALERHVAHDVAKQQNIRPHQVGQMVIMAEVPAGTIVLYTTATNDEAKNWMAGVICAGMSDLAGKGS